MLQETLFLKFIYWVSANKITTHRFWPKHCDLCTSCTSPVSRYQAMDRLLFNFDKLEVCEATNQKGLSHELSRNFAIRKPHMTKEATKKRLINASSSVSVIPFLQTIQATGVSPHFSSGLEDVARFMLLREERNSHRNR